MLSGCLLNPFLVLGEPCKLSVVGDTSSVGSNTQHHDHDVYGLLRGFQT